MNSIFARVSLTLLTVFVGMGVLLVVIVDRGADTLQQETTQQLHRELAAHISHEIDFWKDGQLDMAAIEEALHMMMVLGPANELYVISPGGEILAHASPEELVLRDAVDVSSISLFLTGDANFPIVGDDPRSIEAKKIFSVVQLHVPDQPVSEENLLGYLYIILGGQNYDSTLAAFRSSHSTNVITATMLASIAFFLLVSLILFLVLTRPIRELARYIHEFRQNDFLKLPLKPPPGKGEYDNEVERLGTTLAEMAEKIVSQFDDMIQSKKHHQELVAHISHDLRTPLAGVQGYLETWKLKEQYLPREESRKFVEIAMKHCEQLARLVDELFVLARLEGNDLELHREKFPLNELVSDLVQKMNLLARKKNIELVFSAEKDMPFVDADIAQIDRVFSNLVENAIRHTGEGGKVVVDLSNKRPSQQERSVSVTISDNGCGIAKDQLSKLFDPYFRGGDQNKQYPKSTGLGLAITKRLLELHDVAITVQSKKGNGTVFQFSLPVAC